MHEAVAAALVPRAGVVLHQLAHDGTLGVPHGEPSTDLGGKAHEVELGRQLAVVALLGFHELVEVGLERRLRLPRGAVDALQHRALLVAPPVRAGHLLQLEVTQAAGGRNVRPTAEVDERVGVAVHADRPARTDLARIVFIVGRDGADALDDLALVGLVGEDRQGLVGRDVGADERLVFGDDLAHPVLDAFEVALAERLAAGEIEVVVEAVLDRRADRELGAGEQLGDRLRHHVRGGVAQDVAAFVAAVGHDRHRRTVGNGRRQIGLGAVHRGGDGRLGEARPDRRGDVEGGRAGGVLARRAVRQ